MSYARIFVAFGCLLSACYPRTQVVLTIQGDPIVEREASEIVVRVDTARGVTTLTIQRSQLADAGMPFLPLRIPLASRDGRGTYTVDIEARKVEGSLTGNSSTRITTVLARNHARSVFVVGKVTTLPLWLLSGCMCDAQQRCVPGPGFVPECQGEYITPIEDHPDAGIDSAIEGGVNRCEPGFHLCGESCMPNGGLNSCGNRCSACPSVEGGTSVCVAGACSVRCNGTRMMCGAACVDATSSQQHCGVCDRACLDRDLCVGGVCSAPPSCTVGQADACPQRSYCNAGQCVPGCDALSPCETGSTCNLGTHECVCPSGAMRCGGVCAVCPINARSTMCNSANQCVATTCNAPSILCNGACTTESVNACGAACQVCAVENGTASCSAGNCAVASCSSGYLSCAGVCAQCPSAATVTCDGNRCVASTCNAAQAFCGGQCIAESPTQCGPRCSSCSVANGLGRCSNGSCSITRCDSGYLSCAGVCAVCPSGASRTACNDSACVATACSTGYALCQGSCIPDSNNQCGANCANCAIANGQGRCSEGSCSVASCNPGYLANATNTQCIPCIPNCAGRSCGDNGCGGSCGTCATGDCTLAGSCAVLNWRQVPTTSPASRFAACFAYDSYRHRVVLFAGLTQTNTQINIYDDTWEWDGVAWTRQNVSVRPPHRSHTMMAYDAGRRCVVLFGGETTTFALTNDTWEWDGTTWTRRMPAVSPPERNKGAMVYDSARQRILLVGGSGSRDDFSDTWEWDGTNWTERARAPASRHHHSMAFDAARQRAVVYGGFTSAGSYFPGVWEWNGSTWSQLSTSSPEPK